MRGGTTPLANSVTVQRRRAIRRFASSFPPVCIRLRCPEADTTVMPSARMEISMPGASTAWVDWATAQRLRVTPRSGSPCRPGCRRWPFPALRTVMGTSSGRMEISTPGATTSTAKLATAPRPAPINVPPTTRSPGSKPDRRHVPPSRSAVAHCRQRVTALQIDGDGGGGAAALGSDGNVYDWGYVGYGPNNRSDTPVEVRLPPGSTPELLGQGSMGAPLLIADAPDVAPAVITQPTSQSVDAGAPASFNAAASGFPTPTVQWEVSTDGGAHVRPGVRSDV